MEAGGIEPPIPACKAGVFPLAPRPRRADQPKAQRVTVQRIRGERQ